MWHVSFHEACKLSSRMITSVATKTVPGRGSNMFTTTHVEHPNFEHILSNLAVDVARLSICHQKSIAQFTQLNHRSSGFVSVLGATNFEILQMKVTCNFHNFTQKEPRKQQYITNLHVGCDDLLPKINQKNRLPLCDANSQKSGLMTQISSAALLGDEVCFISDAELNSQKLRFE